MSNGGSNSPRPTKNERRLAAREKARELREAQKKRERRNKIFLQLGIGVGVLAVLGIIALVIVTSIKPPSPGPKNMASDGILIGKGMKVVTTPGLEPSATPIVHTPNPDDPSTVRIVSYVDYLCPYCGEFERTNSEQIGKLVDSGAATVEIHPIPLLAAQSQGTKYSLRATNAAACVANYSPDSFWDFNSLLFENQPQEGTAGLTNNQIKDFIKKAQPSDLSAINSCVNKGTFNSWAQDALNRALAGPIPNSEVEKLTGTPLVLVNGQQYQGSLTDADAFRAFIVQAQSENYTTATPTPTPAPTK